MSKMFKGSAPLFLVTDIERSVDYYCDILGFDRPFMWDSHPPFAMPKREDIIIMLEQLTDNSVRNNEGKWDAYFWVNDVKSLFEEFKSKGANIHYELEFRQFYGNLEFAIKDPDHYILAFAQEMDKGTVADQEKPETKFLYISPVLASANVEKDIKWYEEKLGFKNVFDSSAYKKGPIDYAVVGRQNLFLHLQFQYPKDVISTDVRLEVQNIGPLIGEFVGKGILNMDRVRQKTDWNTTEFGLFDPNRNRITFFEDL